MTEIKLLLVLVAITILPGWTFLSVSGLWIRWRTLQRWCIAIGISIAFYPVLYYWARLIFPGLDLGVNKLNLMLVVFGGISLWTLRGRIKDQFTFESSEWIAIGIFLATLFTRFWFAHLHPYPAWSDSLHHTLLTQLTAQHGGLPYTLESYEPVPLGMYHLGLYAITAPVQLLSQVPAHTALLWTGQALNGLCTLGIFLVLDRKIGRNAALVGSVVVGLLSFQPAWYVNWGRFTQVASQSILFIAWLVTWEAIRVWAQPGKRQWMELIASTISSALLTASVFLLHFRVAGFYLPLLAFVVVWEFYLGIRRRNIGQTIVAVLVNGLASLLFAFPALFSSLEVYIANTSQSSSTTSLAENTYYNGATLDSILQIGVHPWLFYAAIVGLLFLLIRKNKFGFLMLSWLCVLWMIANAYLLDIPLLAFTNPGAVIIMLYLPFSLILGTAIGELIAVLPVLQKNTWQTPLLVVLLIIGFIGGQLRIGSVEPYRYFMTEDDLAAMNWIRKNTPEDAVFAINTFMWLGTFPHGIDGGYWIPYFTGRKTTTGTMLFSLGTSEYQEDRIEQNNLLLDLSQNKDKQSVFCNQKVGYIYDSATTSLSLTTIDMSVLAHSIDASPLFEYGSIKIYKMCE